MSIFFFVVSLYEMHLSPSDRVYQEPFASIMSLNMSISARHRVCSGMAYLHGNVSILSMSSRKGLKAPREHHSRQPWNGYNFRFGSSIHTWHTVAGGRAVLFFSACLQQEQWSLEA